MKIGRLLWRRPLVFGAACFFPPIRLMLEPAFADGGITISQRKSRGLIGEEWLIRKRFGRVAPGRKGTDSHRVIGFLRNAKRPCPNALSLLQLGQAAQQASYIKRITFAH